MKKCSLGVFRQCSDPNMNSEHRTLNTCFPNTEQCSGPTLFQSEGRDLSARPTRAQPTKARVSQGCVVTRHQTLDVHPCIHPSFLGLDSGPVSPHTTPGLVMHTVHKFANFCSRSQSTSTVWNRTLCEDSEGTLLHGEDVLPRRVHTVFDSKQYM